jgi:hypothetical protein
MFALSVNQPLYSYLAAVFSCQISVTRFVNFRLSTPAALEQKLSDDIRLPRDFFIARFH